MVDDFLIARNPEPRSSLPYLLRIPLGPDGVVLKAKEMWPRTAKVYCHRAEWPDDAEIVERTPTRTCVRRGAAIDLVLDRGRENRSQLVLTQVRGREAIFWQTARTAKQARPSVRSPRARAAGIAEMQVVVDSHERYAWKFSDEQVTTVRRGLPVGDYAVEVEGRPVAVVERKSLPDLVSTLTSGRLRYALAELATVPRAAVVVEARYSDVFKLDPSIPVRPSVVAEGLAECQARVPSVPVIFAETRALAQQWTYRFFGACLVELAQEDGASARVADLSPGPGMPPREPTPAEIRAWAVAEGLPVSARGGRLAASVVAAYRAAHGDTSPNG